MKVGRHRQNSHITDKLVSAEISLDARVGNALKAEQVVDLDRPPPLGRGHRGYRDSSGAHIDAYDRARAGSAFERHRHADRDPELGPAGRRRSRRF